MADSTKESMDIRASAEALYDMISDVRRMGEWSPEATGARFAKSRPSVGDRFVGTNKLGRARWFTICTVRRADRGRCFEFDVDFGPLPIARWRYDFEPADGGTRVTESWTDRRSGFRGAAVNVVGRLLIPGDRGRHNGSTMRTTLKRLKAAAESGA